MDSLTVCRMLLLQEMPANLLSKCSVHLRELPSRLRMTRYLKSCNPPDLCEQRICWEVSGCPHRTEVKRRVLWWAGRKTLFYVVGMFLWRSCCNSLIPQLQGYPGLPAVTLHPSGFPCQLYCSRERQPPALTWFWSLWYTGPAKSL